MNIKILCIILILISPLKSEMTVKPDENINNDRYFVDDNTIADENMFNEVVWAYTMGTTKYEDYYQGTIWEANSNFCYEKDNPLTKATYNIGQVLNNPTIDFSKTKNKYLYDQTCSSASTGLYIPLNLHQDADNFIYKVDLKLLNPSATDTSFELLFENIFTPPISQTLHRFNHPSPVVVPANSIKTYSFKFTASPIGGIDNYYYLSEESYATKYTTAPSVWPNVPVVPPAVAPPLPIYHDNSLLTNNPVTSYPAVKPNIRLMMEYITGVTHLAGIMVQIERTTANAGTTGNNSCDDGRKCSYNFRCQGNICSPCQSTCKDCTANNITSCTKCFANSKDWNNTISGECVQDHVDFTRLNEIKIPVPPAIHYSTTMEFWTFVHKTNNLEENNINIIYTDFMNFAIHANKANPADLTVFCTPIDYWYPIYKYAVDRNSALDLLEVNTSNVYYKAFNIKQVHLNASSKWIHTRCAFSFQLRKSYHNDSPEETLTIPQMYEGEISFSNYFKKFYRQEDTVDFIIENALLANLTNIYFKNFVIYRTYIPQNYIYKYFNMYKHTSFDLMPQLLWTIPFDDLNLNTSEISVYDYSLRINTVDIQVDPYIVEPNPACPACEMIPKKNFRRLNLLDPYKKYSETDLLPSQISDIPCNVTNAESCYEDDKVSNCIPDCYLDMQSNVCDNKCPDGYMRYPLDFTYNKKSWCLIKCHLNSQICPYDDTNYKQISDFQCQSGFISTYFTCNDSENKWNDTALQIGYMFKSHAIDIDLKTSYDHYVIDVWVYPDMRFMSNVEVNDYLHKNTIDNIPDKDTIYGPPWTRPYSDEPYTPVMFLTNNHRVRYEDNVGNHLDFIYSGFNSPANQNYVRSIRTKDTMNLRSWNHFILFNDRDVDTKVYFSTIRQHFPNDPAPNEQTNSIVPLTNIYFCSGETEDSTNIDPCKGTIWIDAFYKDLKVWNSKWANMWTVENHHQFIMDKPISLRHWFTLDMQYSNLNQFIDKLNPNTVKGTIPFAGKGQNPDNYNFFNYAAFYSYDDIYPGKFITKATLSNQKELEIDDDNCDESCERCYNTSNSDCVKCKDGWGYRSHECMATNPKYYYYKNPPSKSVPKISLNVSEYNLQDHPAITLSWFMKIYSFNDYKFDMIIFDSTHNFKLVFNDDMTSIFGGIELWYEGDLQYSYDRYRNELFGRWIPMSIAMYREYEPWLYPNMHSMSIYNELVPRADENNYIHAFVVTEFSILKDYIGLVADLNIYHSYVTNAWSLGKWYDNTEENTKFILKTYPLKSRFKSTFCLNDSEMVSTTAIGVGIQCVSDYNPYFDYNCGENNNNDFNVDPNDEPNCDGNCNCATDMCIIGNDEGRCNNLTHGCEHRARNHVEAQLFWENNSRDVPNRIHCDNENGLDWARYQEGSIQGITNPKLQSSYSIDLWWYTQSYVIQNFKRFTITWNYHNRIRFSFTNQNFIAECYPIVDINNPTLDTSSMTINEGPNDRTWRYFNCGVDTIDYNYTISNTGIKGPSQSFSSSIIIPLGDTILHFKEESPTNFGVVYFRQLRLWSCYQCSLAFWHLLFLPGSPLYFNVYHCYTGYTAWGTLTDQQVPPVGGGTSHTFQERLDFHGYNVLYQIGNPIWCNETDFTYWNPNINNCSRLHNLARLEPIVIQDQPSSRVDRWSMEFWCYIEENFNLTNGINLIYDYQIGITLIRDKTDLSALATLCFPQEYRDNLNGKIGPETFDLYSAALNKEQDTLQNSSSKWNFFRCAVDNSNQVMYLNYLPLKKMIPEYIYGNQQEVYQYRYFDIPIYVDLTLEHAKENKTRIFFKQWRVYREFLPQETMKIKYKDMLLYANINTWPLVFVCDFEFPGGGLPYYTIDVDSDPKSANINVYNFFFVVDLNPLYTTYPVFYLMNMCNTNEIGDDNNNCNLINSPITCDDNSTYCQDEDEMWWCWNNTYLDLNDMTCKNTCPFFLTRMPDSTVEGSYCRWDCAANNYNSCPSTSPEIDQSNYKLETTWQCNPGYHRVYYRCLDNNYIERSGFYLSTFYSFTPMIVDYSADAKRDYYIELWFIIDSLNQVNPVPIDHYYLLSPPHFIFKSAVDQLYKYGNYNISGGSFYYTISSISEYEWNKVIIHTQYHDYNDSFSINIYMNYNFVNADVSINNLDANLQPMHLQGFAFCNTAYSTCLINGVSYTPTWGTAFYKNVRVWDHSMATLYSIQQFDKLYSNNVKSMFYYYKFQIDSIFNDKILDELDSANDMTTMWWFPNIVGGATQDHWDDDKRVNYSIDFDYGYFYPGFYVNQIDDVTKAKVNVSCHSYCKRCYSPSVENCYECKEGFSLHGTTCHVSTNTYFKTPTNDLTVTNVKFIDKYVTPVTFDISTQNPITITLWMRWFGIQYELPDKDYYEILYLNGVTTSFGFNLKNKSFMIKVDTTDAFEYDKILDHVGEWTHFSFSVYRSSDSTVFPHMFNFMIQQKMQAPLLSFNVKDTEVKLDNITFGTENVALFSNLRFFNNFYGGSYGLTTGTKIILSNDLIFEYRLNGSGSQNCVADSELDGQTVSGIDLLCENDYSPYDNLNIQCNDDNKYFDISLLHLTPPCELCDKDECMTQCFKGDNKSCTCTFNSMLYWLETQEPPESYNCYKVRSINWSYYEPLELTGLSNTDNDEIGIDFWVHIHTYRDLKFDYLDISWNHHARIRIIYELGVYKAKCYPYVDISDLNLYNKFYEINFTEKSWFYVRCATDNYYKKYYINKLIEAKYPEDLPSFVRAKTTSLKIEENIINWNYGFSFIRELKLTSSYHFQFWDPSLNYLDAKNYKYLLHYFRTTFENGDESIIDLSTSLKYPLIRREGLIGYNYVVGFNELTQCPEGQIFKASICQDYSSSKCRYSSNSSNNCLICKDNKFLHKDSDCYAECPKTFYGDIKLQQCRSCDTTCYTCFGKYFNNCLSCIGDRYLVKHLFICVLDCEEYGLTISLDEPNVCGPFTIKGKITNFDITKPQDPNTFNKIEVELYDSTALGYSVNWKYKDEETNNQNENNIEPEWIPPEFLSPIIGSNSFLDAPKNFTWIDTDPQFFDESFKYVFVVNVNKKGINGIVTVPIEFVITMNDYPQNGTLLSVPDTGMHKTTALLLQCKGWSDENTDKERLQYKFSYMNEKEEEITIQDYSEQFETNKIFELPKALNNYGTYNYTINCYIMDEMSAVNSTSISIKVTSDKSSSDNMINNVLKNQDFEEELKPYQYYKRTVTIKSLTTNFFTQKDVLNRTIIKPLKDGNLNHTDPKEDSDFCNYRGKPLIIDRFLVCFCEATFTGANCQIDLSTYSDLENLFFKLWKGMKSTLTLDATGYVIPGLLNLVEGASYFISNSDYMTDQVFDFINLCKVKYVSDLLSYSKEFYSYFAANLNWGTFQINSMKAEISQSYNADPSILRNTTITNSQKPALATYYRKVKEGIDDLTDWYAKNLPLQTEGINFRSEFLLVNITHLTNSFEYLNYFSKVKTMYDPYFEMKTCLVETMKNNYNKRSFKLVQTFVNYFNSPFYYEEDIYHVNAGNLVTINYYDYDEKEQLVFKECKDYVVNIYFPVATHILPDFLNNYRNRSDPATQFTKDADIFSDPAYITPSGEIDFSSVEDRRFKWWVPINFTCNFLEDYTSDSNTIKTDFISEGCVYKNYTDNYFHCQCSHLTNFVANYYVIPVNWFLKSRFFYLIRPELYKWIDNYVSNPALYMFIIVIIIYASIFLIFAMYDCYLRRLNALLNHLKDQVVKMNMPYLRSYNFNIGTIFAMENINRGKRAVEILDDHKRTQPKITNYNFKKDENALTTNIKENEFNLKIDNFQMHDVDVMILGDNLGNNRQTNLQRVSNKEKSVNFIDNYKNKINKKRDLMDEILGDDNGLNLDEDIEKDNDNDVFSKATQFKNNKITDSESNKQFNNYLISEKEVRSYNNPRIIANNNLVDNFNNLEEDPMDELPLLNRNITYEALIQEFASAQLTTCEFFRINILRRHMLLSSLRYSKAYGRFRKIGNLCAYLSAVMFGVSNWITFDRKMTLENMMIYPLELIKFIGYCSASAIFASILIYPIGRIFYINLQEFRDLYYVLISNPGLKIFNAWNKLFHNKKCKTFWGLFLQLITFSISFYVSFGHAAVYKYQNNTWIFGVLLTLILDFFIFEIVWELFIAFMYSKRKQTRNKLKFAEWLNRIRDMKCLP